MSSTSGSAQPSSSTAAADVSPIVFIPSPGEFTPGLDDKFPDLLPPRAFYLAEVRTPAFTPADLVALKELVETDGWASLKLKKAWVPFEGCPSGALPLDVYEELSSSGSLLVSPRNRAALDSVDKVHRDCQFQSKRSRRIQNQSAPRSKDLQIRVLNQLPAQWNLASTKCIATVSVNLSGADASRIKLRPRSKDLQIRVLNQLPAQLNLA